jgi:hypothetical protein
MLPFCVWINLAICHRYVRLRFGNYWLVRLGITLL